MMLCCHSGLVLFLFNLLGLHAVASQDCDGAAGMAAAESWASELGLETGLPQLNVTYASGRGGRVVTLAAQFSRGRDRFLHNPPVVAWPPSLCGATPCALLMLDQDGRDGGPTLHGLWAIPPGSARDGISIDGDDGCSEGVRLSEMGVWSPDTVADYLGPTPRSGNHRYVWLLFELRAPSADSQPSAAAAAADTPPPVVDDLYGMQLPKSTWAADGAVWRVAWDVRTFVRKNLGLRLVAMSFFCCDSS